MQKEDYVTGLQREDTFCCRLERELAHPGSRDIAEALDYGLYFCLEENKYHFARQFGADPDEAMETIRELITNDARFCRIFSSFRCANTLKGV